MIVAYMCHKISYLMLENDSAPILDWHLFHELQNGLILLNIKMFKAPSAPEACTTATANGRGAAWLQSNSLLYFQDQKHASMPQKIRLIIVMPISDQH